MSDSVIVETSRALPIVSFSVSQASGATEDPRGKAGLARILGRLMRRTAGGRGVEELDTQIDTLGGTLGVGVSGSVFAVHGAVLTRSIEPFIALVEEMLAQPGLDENELERLKRETLADIIETRDSDSDTAQLLFRQHLYGDHAYARTATGTSNTVTSITAADVQQQHAARAQRDGFLFAFSGDIDASEAQNVATRLRASLGAGTGVSDTTPAPRFQSGRRLMIVDKPDRTQTQILIGGSGTHAQDPDHLALCVANTAFGGTFTARLSQEVRAKRGWSYGAYSSLSYDRQRRAFSMWTFPKTEDAGACLKLQLDMLKSFHDNGITLEELDAAKQYLQRSNAFSIDTPAKRADLQLDSKLYDLPPGYHDDFVERIGDISLEQANAAVRARIPCDNLAILVLGTKAALGQTIDDAIEGLSSRSVVPHDQELVD
ncbi:MAG: insulinase family protein [Polyangiaceae bacterium]|nr:insulinase family protein [Polyangiaceae bacterium]